MRRRRRARRFPAAIGVRALGLTLATALAFAASGCGNAAREAQPTPDAWVTIRDAEVATEIARSLEQKTRGLGGRDALAWNHGMLFAYERPGFLSFWMKDMRFSIDIVWIRDGRIVDIAHRVPWSPEGPGPTLRPHELADTVLEVPAGYAQANGWRRGDRVEIRETGGP